MAISSKAPAPHQAHCSPRQLVRTCYSHQHKGAEEHEPRLKDVKERQWKLVVHAALQGQDGARGCV